MIERDACGTALLHLESASLLDDSRKWISAWTLLDKVRTAASVATVTGAVITLPVMILTANAFPVLKTSWMPIAFISFGVGSVTIRVAYQIAARLALGSGVDVPPFARILRIRNTLAPFDGVAKEYIRLQNGHAS